MSFIAYFGGLIGLLIGILAVMALVGKGSLGKSVRGFLGMIPFGSPKLWAAILIVLVVIGGGFGYGWTYIKGLSAGTLGTATLTGATTTAAGYTPDITCEIAQKSVTPTGYGSNVTFRADPTNLQHYYVDVKEVGGPANLNGTLTCKRSAADIDKAGAINCYVKGDSFRSETSTTDSNVYYILATSASASKVPGMLWSQTAYLNNGGVATTASDKEQTTLTYAGGASASASQTLGYYFTLPGTAIYDYVANQTSHDITLYCGGQPKFRWTISKVAGIS